MFNIICISEFSKREEDKLLFKKLVSNFSCLNNDVERFLKNKSMQSFEKGVTNTFLITKEDSYGKNILLGYFTIMLKAITITDDQISNTNVKRLSRFVTRVENENSFHIPTFFVAQLGKNNIQNNPLQGSDIIDAVKSSQLQLKNIVNSKTIFLHSINEEKVIKFYESCDYVNLFTDDDLILMLHYN